MPASEAQIRANQANAALSTGPKTIEGKAASRANSFKHGLSGAGIVLPNEDVAEVEDRLASFREELQPSGEVGEALVRRAAFLSVRLDRCVSEETARLSGRIRQAEAEFVAPSGVDAQTLAQLKAEARARAMFDPSPEATRARQYEAAAERGFHKALKELRQLETLKAKPTMAAEPDLAAENFREALASFSRFNEDCEAFEAKHFDEDLRTRSTSIKRPESASLPTSSSRVDIPITIGQSR